MWLNLYENAVTSSVVEKLNYRFSTTLELTNKNPGQNSFVRDFVCRFNTELFQAKCFLNFSYVI